MSNIEITEDEAQVAAEQRGEDLVDRTPASTEAEMVMTAYLREAGIGGDRLGGISAANVARGLALRLRAAGLLPASDPAPASTEAKRWHQTEQDRRAERLERFRSPGNIETCGNCGHDVSEHWAQEPCQHEGCSCSWYRATRVARLSADPLPWDVQS